MKALEVSLTRDGVRTNSIDLGDWDISVGLDTTIYITNPNKYARADLKGMKNKDARLYIDIPDEIGPGKTVPVKVKINGKQFSDAVEEEGHFKDILDKISGRIVWRTP